jgi:hypothetical protein
MSKCQSCPVSALMRYAMTRVSSNRKTGPIATVTAADETCWQGCAFYKKCYPTAGPLNMHWKAVSSGVRGVLLPELLEQIESLYRRSVWRWGDAGDVPGAGSRIDAAAIGELIKVNAERSLLPIIYSHKPVLWDDLPGQANIVALNRVAITTANLNGLTISLSAEGFRRADRLVELDIAPVVTVVPTAVPADWRKLKTPAGNTVLRCPAEFVPGFTCARCGGAAGPLCGQVARQRRGQIVGFTAHGPRRYKIDNIIAEVEMRELALASSQKEFCYA